MQRAHMRLHCSDKRITVSIKILSIFITVFFHSGQEPCHRLHERIIVHDRIPLISLQPSFRTSIMFCKNQCFRIRFLDRFTEIFPELVIKLIAVSQICCHIQSPAIHIIWCRHPLLCHFQDIIIQFS